MALIVHLATILSRILVIAFIRVFSFRSVGESKKLAHEYKFQLKKAEQDIIVLQGNVSRLETQVARFRQSTEESEKLEDELKKEKRNILRDVSCLFSNMISCLILD